MAATDKLRVPRGVTLREFAYETRFQVAFSFQGVECRELLPPQPITQGAATRAGGLRSEIVRRIAEKTFHYADYFPDSPRARQFDSAASRLLISDKLQDQLEIYRKQVANGTMSPSTLEGYEKAIKSQRMAHWTGKTLPEATPGALRDWIGAFGVTAKRARNLLIPLRSMFEDALNDQVIEFNPFDRISLDKLLRQTSKASDYEADPYTRAEQSALIAAARPDERPMLEFWFETGLRPGELFALRRAKVDVEARKVRIDMNFVAKTDKLPKTAAGIRTVDLSDQALAAAQAQLARLPATVEHLWLNPRTGEPWESDAQLRKTLWKPLCDRAEVTYRNPYQVRHTFASTHLTDGANPWYIADQLGHADVEMVYRVYGKFIAADFQRPKAQGRAGSA